MCYTRRILDCQKINSKKFVFQQYILISSMLNMKKENKKTDVMAWESSNPLQPSLILLVCLVGLVGLVQMKE